MGDYGRRRCRLKNAASSAAALLLDQRAGTCALTRLGLHMDHHVVRSGALRGLSKSSFAFRATCRACAVFGDF